MIGLDGARPELLQSPDLPTIRSLIEGGTVCWQVQAVMPSITEVNWPALLAGSTPAKTGMSEALPSEDSLRDIRLQVPTIFEVVAQNGGRAVGLLGHWKLYSIDTGTPGPFIARGTGSSSRVTSTASLHITAEKPTFTFVYMGDLDGLGHNYGWLSEKQVAAMPKIDRSIQQLLLALDRAGIRDDTLVMIVSDHGGTDRRHSVGTPEDRTVPWILVGPGIRPGHVIEDSLPIYDIAATALHALGMSIPEQWDGQPVKAVFGP